ncbi:MAG: YCF48-related protein [bacterium]
MKNRTIFFVIFLFMNLSLFGQVSEKPIKGSNSASGVVDTPKSTYDWEVVTCPVTTDLTAVSIVDASVSWIAGEGGVVLKSLDGGTTWTKCTNVTGNVDLYCISAYDASKVIVGDGSGNIFRTTDAGTTWAKVSTNAGSFMDVVDYVDADLAYALGDPTSSVWRLLKSTDGGATWALATSLAAASGEAGWNCAYERIGLNVWFGTNKTKIYKSTSGLEGPWTSGVTGTYVNSYGIAFSDELRGIAIVNDATNGKIMTTTDGGTNWTLAGFPVTGLANLADFVNGTPYVWVGTFSNGILHSSDYGTTWVADNLPTSVTGVNAIKVYPDVQNGLAVGASGLILKSQMPNVIPVELISFTAASIDGKVVLNWSTATETNNSGFAIERSLDNTSFSQISFVSGYGSSTEKHNYSFTDASAVTGTYFYRLKQIDYDGTVNFLNSVKVEVGIPAEFAISQNYPNPFNPSTTITFAVPIESNVTINLFNTLGQQVANIVDGNFTAGSHVLSFNASALSSGIYFYTIEANGLNGKNFVAAKKMTLMK